MVDSHARLVNFAERPLGPFRGRLQHSQRLSIAARVFVELGFMKGFGDVIDDAVVPIFAAEADVAFDGERLKRVSARA